MLSVTAFLDVLSFITFTTFCTGEPVLPKDVFKDSEIFVCLLRMLTDDISNMWDIHSHLSPCVDKLQLIPLRKIKNQTATKYTLGSPELLDCSKNSDMTQNIQCIFTSVIIEFYKLKGYHADPQAVFEAFEDIKTIRIVEVPDQCHRVLI